MPRVIVQLAGGLGNQLFQYAAARAFAERSRAELVIDASTGFARDFEYGRSYALARFPITARKATAVERAPFWIHRTLSAVNRRLPTNGRDASGPPRWKHLRVETSPRAFDPEALAQPAKASTWMTGYWQSPRYFEHISDELRRELAPPPPASSQANSLGNDAAAIESVAIGVRLYEETRQPGANSSDGKIKTIAEINRAIETLSSRSPAARYLIFCSHRAPELEAIRTPTPPVYVTSDEGFVDAEESLWLMSRCKHHVLTNSTFYWWGAWLSQRNRNGMVFAANNFINVDSLPADWIPF